MEVLLPVKETLFVALIHGYHIVPATSSNTRFYGGEDTFGDLTAVCGSGMYLANQLDITTEFELS